MGDVTDNNGSADVADNNGPADVAGNTNSETGTLLNSQEGGEGSVDDTGGDTAGEQTGESNQAAPDTYADFAMPEGVTVDSDLLAEASPIFKELGLNQEQAQKLVDFQAKQVEAGSQKQVDAFNQLMDDWQTKSRNDSEFGGDKFEENMSIAKSAVDKFGTPELKQLLEEHGVGNHPEVIRFMLNVGKLTQEDNPSNNAQPKSKAQDRVSQLYPSESA